MCKKALFLVFFMCTTFCAYASPLNTRNASNCLSQIRDFISDDDSYYVLSIDIANVSGRIQDNDQINIENRTDRLYISILFRNEVYLRIHIEKSSYMKDEDDGIYFLYSDPLGFGTTYKKSYDKYEQREIEYVFLNIFRSFGL